MSWKQRVFLACVASAVLCVPRGWSEEAKGVISGTGFGSFTITDGGTLRQFNLSSKNTLYAPATWRPPRGDDVRVAFFRIEPGFGFGLNYVADAVEKSP